MPFSFFSPEIRNYIRDMRNDIDEKEGELIMFEIIYTVALVIFAMAVAFVGAMTFTMNVKPLVVNEHEGFLQNR